MLVVTFFVSGGFQDEVMKQVGFIGSFDLPQLLKTRNHISILFSDHSIKYSALAWQSFTGSGEVLVRSRELRLVLGREQVGNCFDDNIQLRLRKRK